MTHTRANHGVCSTSTTVELGSDGIIQNVQVENGCDGNLQGLCALLKGMPAQQGIERMQNIRCGGKNTSCPGQISLCLEQALKKIT